MGNSVSVPQRTAAGLQQSASAAQNSPSWASVQGAQRVVSLVQTSPPAPSETQPHPQQSPSVVQDEPSGRQVAPQRSTPAASGVQMPPQHSLPVLHVAASGRQQTIEPAGFVPQVIAS